MPEHGTSRAGDVMSSVNETVNSWWAGIERLNKQRDREKERRHAAEEQRNQEMLAVQVTTVQQVKSQQQAEIKRLQQENDFLRNNEDQLNDEMDKLEGTVHEHIQTIANLTTERESLRRDLDKAEAYAAGLAKGIEDYLENQLGTREGGNKFIEIMDTAQRFQFTPAPE